MRWLLYVLGAILVGVLAIFLGRGTNPAPIIAKRKFEEIEREAKFDGEAARTIKRQELEAMSDRELADRHGAATERAAYREAVTDVRRRLRAAAAGRGAD